MATLTYDPTPADQPEFNEAEQEALAIGEQAAADQQQMLAGKFKDAEALEQAYIELQKKLGETDGEELPVSETDETEQEEEVEVSPAQSLITEASTMYAETGELTPEVMDKFNSMSSSDLVNAYMEMQGNLPAASSPDLSESEVNQIKNSAGGEEGYQQLMAWSGENLDPSDVEAFDQLVESGNSRLIRLAVSGLKAEMEKSVGFDGELATGRAPYQPADVFRSQAEVVEAMSDPRYDRDPAYRQDVFEKLDRSNINY
jgi:hypothetical protein|tara:strand:- start:1135 stop:1908 length:774 start_codon:yes stop_codon:yes gene_type:complete